MNPRVAKNIPIAINNPSPDNTIEKNKSKKANVSGYSNKLMSTKSGETINATLEVQPAKTTAANAIKGPSTITKLKKDRKSTRLNSSHVAISYAVFCLKKKNTKTSKEISQ